MGAAFFIRNDDFLHARRAGQAAQIVGKAGRGFAAEQGVQVRRPEVAIDQQHRLARLRIGARQRQRQRRLAIAAGRRSDHDHCPFGLCLPAASCAGEGALDAGPQTPDRLGIDLRPIGGKLGGDRGHDLRLGRKLVLDRAQAHARRVADRVHRRARIALCAQHIARGGDHLGAGRGAAGGLAAAGLGGRRHAAIRGDSVRLMHRRDRYRFAQSCLLRSRL